MLSVPEPDLQALGQFLRHQRKSLGLTQSQLAERLGWVQERISLLELGKYGMPSLPALVRLSLALEAPLPSVLTAAGYEQILEQSGHRGPPEAGRLSGDEVLTLLAHDLRNQLTPLKGYVDVIQRRARHEGRERDASDAEAAAHAISRSHHTVSELLDAARLERGVFALQRQPVDLVAAINQSVASFDGQSKRLNARLPDKLVIDADPERVPQVVESILANALTHSRDDTEVSIDVCESRREDGAWADMTVHAAGPDVPEIADQSLDCFSIGTDTEGLRSGLYVARGVVEAHGGTMYSEACGDSTSFHISLPLASRQ